MPDQLVHFKLRGNISLSAFRDALDRFYDFAEAVAEEVAPGQSVEWEIRELQGGSAGGGFAVVTENPEDAVAIRYSMFQSLDAATRGKVIPFGPKVGRTARGVTSLVGDRAEGLEFETDAGLVDVSMPMLFEPKVRTATVMAFGMVKGIVEELARRTSRFVVYAEPEVRPVSCYLEREPESDEVLAHYYGKRVRVVADLERDRMSGRLVRVRNVDPSNVSIIETERPDFEAALGVFEIPEGYPPPEERRAQWED